MLPLESVCLIRNNSVLTVDSPQVPTACSMVNSNPGGASAKTLNVSARLLVDVQVEPLSNPVETDSPNDASNTSIRPAEISYSMSKPTEMVW